MTSLKIISATCNKCKAEIPDIGEENIVKFYDDTEGEEYLAGHICVPCLVIGVEAELEQSKSEMHDCCNYGCIQCDPMQFDPQLNGSYNEGEI